MNKNSFKHARSRLIQASVLILTLMGILSPSVFAQEETLRLFWSTSGLVDPANDNGFTDFPALGADPDLPSALVPKRLYLWARFEGGGVQNWNVITLNVDFTGDPNAEITARDFWSLTTSVAPRWAVHDDGVLSGSSLTGVTLVALPPFSYGATNNATIMVHDPHWSVDTQVMLLGWVEFVGSGSVFLSVGAGAIQQLDGESDSVQFGWNDDPLSGSSIGAASSIADALFGACLLDSDGDGVVDCDDECPLDPYRTIPGVCGCGVIEVDSDGDGYPDCTDACPSDPAKSAPGTCGCGVAELDSDRDGYLDCEDECPFDPLKSVAGVCGCGAIDLFADFDQDGVIDCLDGCPFDPAKTDPGWCGCGMVEMTQDTDSDGVPDCGDECPRDPLKSVAGDCGCYRSEVDTDGDGVADCIDLCPLDPSKSEPGVCDCGVPEVDTDGDGVPDCKDGCPFDPLKLNAGPCGCGFVDSQQDTDGDGVVDCVDGCPLDPTKKLPGVCGCGVPDVDLNSNGVVDCFEAGQDPFCNSATGYGSATENSTGNSGLITMGGSLQITLNDLVIGAVGLPPGSVCILYSGTKGAQVPFGSGALLVSPPVQNGLATLANSAGAVEFAVDLAALQIAPGGVRIFQVVYLDGGVPNTTNALSAAFCQ